MSEPLRNEIWNNTKPKMEKARATIKAWAAELHSGYKNSSSRLKTWLKIAIIAVCAAVLYAVIFLAWTDPTTAHMFFLPVPVEGYHVKAATVSQTVGASGTVLEYTDVTVTSRITADVQKVPVNIGDLITPDTVLLETDQSAYLPAAEAAKQEELAAKTTADKDAAVLAGTQEMYKKGLAAEVEVQDAISTLATAREADAEAQTGLAGANLNLAFTRLKSPLPGNGIVLMRNVSPGDRLVLNGPVFTLGSLDKVYFVAQVEEAMSPFVNKTAKADVVFSSFPSQTFQGVVEKIDPTVNDLTRTFPVYVTIDNPNLLLKPGVTGFARIKLDRLALAVPDAAVMNLYGENASVFVVNEDSRAILTPVRLGLHGHGSYEVLGGLKEGDVVITAGTVYVKENDRVHVNFPDKN